MSDFARPGGAALDPGGPGPWVPLPPAARRVAGRVAAAGAPLKEWGINIYRGVLTGCNEAFIIDAGKRDEILGNCQSDEERERTANLMRPILRGRDIKRYGYVNSGLYLINTHNGIRGKLPRVDIDAYPSVKAHLDRYWDKISTRSDKGDTPYNLRHCIYMDDFFKPKIIWKRVGSILRFSYDSKGHLGLDSTCFATGEHIKFLCCVLNSVMGHYLLKDSPKTGTGDLLVSVQAVEPIRVPYEAKYDGRLSYLLDRQLEGASDTVEKEINDIVFTMYGLSSEEREYVTSCVNRLWQNQ